jgi:nucleotide-binding universal stress UspA family protein
MELAETYGATLHVLYVVDTTYLGSSAAEATTFETLQQVGEEAVSETVETISGRGIEVTGERREGEPYTTILDYAGEVDADVIVMGTHGRSGIDRFLLGSVTEKVVRTSDVPVMTVRIDEA